jgi:hypothetical protein
MPEIWDGGTPSPTDSLLTSGGKSEVSAILLGAYWFPTTDSRDDVADLSRLQMILLLQNSVMKQDEFASK